VEVGCWEEVGSGGLVAWECWTELYTCNSSLYSDSKRDEFSPSLDLLLYISTCTDVDFEQG
jgi:hypothetical protein